MAIQKKVAGKVVAKTVAAKKAPGNSAAAAAKAKVAALAAKKAERIAAREAAALKQEKADARAAKKAAKEAAEAEEAAASSQVGAQVFLKMTVQTESGGNKPTAAAYFGADGSIIPMATVKAVVGTVIIHEALVAVGIIQEVKEVRGRTVYVTDTGSVGVLDASAVFISSITPFGGTAEVEADEVEADDDNAMDDEPGEEDEEDDEAEEEEEDDEQLNNSIPRTRTLNMSLDEFPILSLLTPVCFSPNSE